MRLTKFSGHFANDDFYLRFHIPQPPHWTNMENTETPEAIRKETLAVLVVCGKDNLTLPFFDKRFVGYSAVLVPVLDTCTEMVSCFPSNLNSKLLRVLGKEITK